MMNKIILAISTNIERMNDVQLKRELQPGI